MTKISYPSSQSESRVNKPGSRKTIAIPNNAVTVSIKGIIGNGTTCTNYPEIVDLDNQPYSWQSILAIHEIIKCHCNIANEVDHLAMTTPAQLHRSHEALTTGRAST